MVSDWQSLETFFIDSDFSWTDYCCCWSWNDTEIPNKSTFIFRAIVLSRICKLDKIEYGEISFRITKLSIRITFAIFQFIDKKTKHEI